MAYNAALYPISKDESDAIAVIDSLKQTYAIPGFWTNEQAINAVLDHYKITRSSWDDLLPKIPLYYGTVYPTAGLPEISAPTITTTEDLARQLDEANKGLFDNVWSSLRGFLLIFAKMIWNWVTVDVLGMTKENFDKFLASMISKGLIDDESRAGIADMINTFPKGHTWMYISTFLALFKTFMAVNVSAIGGTLMKRLNRVHTPSVPSPESVIRAAFLDPDLQDRVRKVMAEGGLSEEDQDLMFAANYFTFDLQTIGELRLRDFIDDNRMNEYFDDVGLTPKRREDFIKLLERLPPLADIAVMMGKEAFEPDMVAMMGLELEIPGEFVKYAGEHGLSEDWAKHYWAAHWQQPGLELMFRAFHRRIVDENFLKQFMKVVEIPPYLRDILLQVAYTPLTRVDIRRMYADNILDEEATYYAYRDHGYNHDNALLMLEWTIRYAEPAEKDLSRTQIISLYTDGQLTRLAALSMLQRIGFPAHRAEILLVYSEYEEIKKLQDEQLGNVELLYRDNWIDKPAARAELTKIDLSSERISILIQRWDIKKFIPTKGPSKTDLDKFRRNEIIEEPVYRSEMQRLGYGPKYIDWYVALLAKGSE